MQFKTLFKYRGLYMGCAILLLVMHHGRAFIPAGRINELAAFGYGSVDIFAFCSGVGCFFSYTSDRDPLAFLRRRAARVYPVYLAFMCYWLYDRFSRGGIPVQDVLGNLLCVQWLTGRDPVFNWYMSFMLITYLLTPVFASLAEAAGSRLKAAGLILALLLLSAAFWNTDQWTIIAARMPIFFTGMLFAAESRRRERLERWELVLLLVLTVVGLDFLRRAHASQSETLLWSYSLYWYPFLLIVPGACVLLAAGAQLLERVTAGRWLTSALFFVGKYTFEIFATHYYARGHGALYYVVLSAVYAAVLHLASLVIRKAAGFAGRLIRHREKSA